MNEMGDLMGYFVERMVIELHAIFGFMTNEIRQGQASEWMKSCLILLLIEIQRGLTEGDVS